MRICLYTETALPKIGGQELVVDALAREFLKAGHEAIVLAPWPRRGVETADGDLPYPMFRHPRFISTRRFVGWYRRWLVRLALRRPFDVLHCHSVYPCGYLASLCRAEVGAAVVITSHGGDIHEGNVRLVKPGLRERHVQAIAQADALVAIGRFTADGFRRLCPTAAAAIPIPNGVDLEAVRRPADLMPELAESIGERPYLLFLGRLARRKGVDILLEALSMASIPSAARVVIAGDGDERAELEAQAIALGIADRVRFVGRIGGHVKAALLQHALAVVAPSRDWEAFPLVVLEAYAAGKPVIATRIPGLEDLIEPNQTGWLVASESPSHLAAAIQAALSDPHHTRRLGENARRRAEDYDWSAIAARYLSLFESLRGSRVRRAAV